MKLLVTRMLGFIILQSFVLSAAFANEVTTNNSLGSYSWEAIKVVISLAIVLGIFYLLVNMFKKYTGMNIKSNSSIRVVGGLSLGGKDKVIILEAGEINLLLGVSASGITKLHQFNDNEMNVDDKKMQQASSFGQHIEKIIGNKKP